VWASCIMHGCVISTMFGWCFWFFKKTFVFKQLSIPTLPLLHISHSGSLISRSPPRLGPSHSSLRFFTPLTPPRPVFRISHSDYLTCRSRQVVVAVVDDTYYKITTTNYISKTSLFYLHILTFFVKRNGPNRQILAFHILELWEQCKVVYI